MTNPGFESISQFRDVESLNHYRILQEKGLSADNALRILQIHSRDNSRTPMQWNDRRNGGFTEGEPWIEVNSNYRYINAETEKRGEELLVICNFYGRQVPWKGEESLEGYELLLRNYGESHPGKEDLRPYQCLVLYRKGI